MKTAVAGGDFDPRKLLGVVLVLGSTAVVVSKLRRGRQVSPAEMLGALLGLLSLLGE